MMVVRNGDKKEADSKRKSDWFCKFCKGRDTKQFKNFGWRDACHLCGIAKGTCFASKLEPTTQAPHAGTFASKQVAMQKKHEKEIAKLKGELDAAKKKAADPEKDDEMCDATGEGNRIEQLQAAIRGMEAHKHLPGVGTTLVGLQKELAAARQF